MVESACAVRSSSLQMPVGQEPTAADLPEAQDAALLSTRRAFGVFGVYLLVQVLVQVIVGVILGARLALETKGAADAAAFASALQAFGGSGACVSGAVAGIVVWRMMPRTSGCPLPRSVIDLKSALATAAALLWPLAAGIFLGVLYLLVAAALYPPDASLEAGAFAAMANSRGIDLWLWATFAICCAPAIEEMVFRGALFTALERVWGRVAGGIVVTLAFVVLHSGELAGYPPAMFAVTTLAILTLVLRLRTGGLAAAIAAHTGYNLAVVCNALIA